MDVIDKTVGSFRSVIQDLLVPELKAIQTELKHHGEHLQALEKRLEAMQQETNRRFETMQQEMNKGFELVIQSIHSSEETQERILERLDVKEKVTDLETRMARFEGRLLEMDRLAKVEKIREKESVAV